MNTLWCWFKGVGVVIGGAIALCANCAVAQITPDATLPNNSRVTTQDKVISIDGGTKAGSNLFHSFEQFSVPTGSTAYFNNAADIQNIISRVTGKSISNIDGILQANGTANLFVINPNGIIFGPNASLNIGGSFVASTASSLNFGNGIKFSATDPQTTPLLAVSVPIGLQFGATAAPIRNQSQASPNGATNSLKFPVGLQVRPGKTLALVGGDVTLEGGNLTVMGGQIELGSVADNSLVSLNLTNQGWALGYESVKNFQNIELTQRSGILSFVDASGEGGGTIKVQGKSVLLTDGSKIWTQTLGSQSGGNLTVTASESIELIGYNTTLRTRSIGAGNAGDLTLTTGRLIVQDGAQVLSSSSSSGSGGQLTVNASDAVELIGGASPVTPSLSNLNFVPSGLFSATSGAGNAGGITIKTGRLRIQSGAQVSTSSVGTSIPPNSFKPATGKGGNLTVNASESVELIGTAATGSASSLLATTNGPGSAGNMKLTTGQLIVRDGAAISVSSGVPTGVTYLGDKNNLGRAGELNVTARSILLDKGQLTSETDLGQGGNITLQVQDLLQMRSNSYISSNAGNAQTVGDSGNITINAPSGFIVAAPTENSDITANAFTGSGGKVQINATGIFGLVPRSRDDLERLLGTMDTTKLDPQRLPTSDITAISQSNPILSGVVNINTRDIDFNRGLINLPVEPVEPKLAQGCQAGAGDSQSQFIITGRGGLPPNPREALRNNAVQVDWVSLDRDATNPTGGVQSRGTRQRGSSERNTQKPSDINIPQNGIVEAQGWVVDAHGNITLVAYAPTGNPHSSWFTPASCPSPQESNPKY